MKTMKKIMMSKAVALLIAGAVILGYSSCQDDDSAETPTPNPLECNKFQVFGSVYTSTSGEFLANIRIVVLSANDLKKEVAVVSTDEYGRFVLRGNDAIYRTEWPVYTFLPQLKDPIEKEVNCVRLVFEDPNKAYWCDTIEAAVFYEQNPCEDGGSDSLEAQMRNQLENTPSYCAYVNIEMKPEFEGRQQLLSQGSAQ